MARWFPNLDLATSQSCEKYRSHNSAAAAESSSCLNRLIKLEIDPIDSSSLLVSDWLTPLWELLLSKVGSIGRLESQGFKNEAISLVDFRHRLNRKKACREKFSKVQPIGRR
jgi:hypothetical protein